MRNGDGRYYRSYGGDPFWMTAKFNSIGACGHAITKGDEIFYYPKGKHAYCTECSDGVSAQFESAAADESFYNRDY